MEKILGYDYEQIDITDEFMAACKELKDSEFAKDGEFKLSQAMTAIEIMEPKMDTGMKQIDRKFDTFSPQQLTNCGLYEIIAIFDASFAMLTSWINAQPLDQTVFANMCLFNPEKLKGVVPYLHTASVSIRYAIDLFRLFISTASVSHEEDICLLFSSSQTPAELSLVQYEQEEVEQLLKKTISSLNAEMKKNKGKSPGNIAHLEALSRRFEFLMALFELLTYLLPSAKSMREIDGERFAPDFKKSGTCVFKCIQLINKVISTISLGAQPPATSSSSESTANGVGDGGCAVVEDGNFTWLGTVFDPDAYLYLSPPGFPRQPKLHSRVEAYNYFEVLLDTISKMIRAAMECTANTSIDEFMDLLRRFGEENSTVLSRSILQMIIMPSDHMIFGTISLNEIILNSMNRASGLIDGAGLEESLKILFALNSLVRSHFEDFLSLLVRGFVGVFQTFGSNLARQREKLLRANFDDFGLLVGEANKMEAELEILRIGENSTHIPSVQHIFTNFLLLTLLDLMHYHFSLGFRLRLFLPYEFTYIYWYFGEIVSRSISNLSERICNSLITEYNKNTIHGQKKVTGKRLQQKNRMDNEFRKTLARYKLRAIFFRVECLMAHAMLKLTAGLIATRQLAVPPRERVRYMKRMETFAPLSHMLFYTHEEYFRESRFTELLEQPSELTFAEAAHHFGQAIEMAKDIVTDERMAVEQDNEITTLLYIQRTAKQNMIVAKLLATQKLTKKMCFEFNSTEKQHNFPLIRFL